MYTCAHSLEELCNFFFLNILGNHFQYFLFFFTLAMVVNDFGIKIFTEVDSWVQSIYLQKTDFHLSYLNPFNILHIAENMSVFSNLLCV